MLHHYITKKIALRINEIEASMSAYLTV